MNNYGKRILNAPWYLMEGHKYKLEDYEFTGAMIVDAGKCELCLAGITYHYQVKHPDSQRCWWIGSTCIGQYGTVAQQALTKELGKMLKKLRDNAISAGHTSTPAIRAYVDRALKAAEQRREAQVQWELDVLIATAAWEEALPDLQKAAKMYPLQVGALLRWNPMVPKVPPDALRLIKAMLGYVPPSVDILKQFEVQYARR